MGKGKLIMENIWNEFRAYCGKIEDLRNVAALLDYDQQVVMPSGGATARAEQAATISGIIHHLSTSAELENFLEQLEQKCEFLPAESVERCLWQRMKREFERSRRIPEKFVTQCAALEAQGYTKWMAAREEDDFSILSDTLTEIFRYKMEYVEFFPEYENKYDALLADYDRDITTENVLKIFDELKAPLQQLIALAGTDKATHLATGRVKFPAERQFNLARQLAGLVGFDLQNDGVMALAEHPFTTTIGSNDVRITTNIDENDFISNIYSVLHEAGHGIFEQHCAPELARSVLSRDISLSLHESQSRLWENMVGRSFSVTAKIYEMLKREFPGEVNFSAEDFFRRVNHVRPSLIRVEADEVTYNMHIILRTELELAIVNGQLAVRDLPDAWNEKMHTLFGITPDSDLNGVLQDVHWPSGAIGYFPTYLLGNVIGGQIWSAVRQLPQIASELELGETAALRNYLIEHIYQYGGKYSAPELLRKLYGTNLQVGCYVDYLNEKYQNIYR